MKYIQFNSKTFAVKVTDAPRRGGVNIRVARPSFKENPFHARIPVASYVYEDVIYPAVEAEDRREGRTSVGANYREASRGRSKAEFISKIGDCLKEIDETEYWLERLVDSDCVPAANMADLLDETRQLIAIFTTIDKNSKRNL